MCIYIIYINLAASKTEERNAEGGKLDAYSTYPQIIFFQKKKKGAEEFLRTPSQFKITGKWKLKKIFLHSNCVVYSTQHMNFFSSICIKGIKPSIFLVL